MGSALTATAERDVLPCLNGRQSLSSVAVDKPAKSLTVATGPARNDEHATTAWVIQAIDAERQRIGRELHDGVAQVITATIFLLDRCLLDEPTLPDTVRSALQRARGLLDETTVDLYRLVNDLRPRIVEELGFVEALRWYSRRWAHTTGTEVQCELDEAVQLEPDAEASLFRIVQEALANVHKHALASRVVIGLRWVEDRITLTIRDNGQGLRPNTNRPAGSLGGNGLSAMCERARLLGGELAIFSVPGIGTDLTVRVPRLHVGSTDEHPIEIQQMKMEDAPCLVSG